MNNEELINDYLDYLKYERKVSINTIKSYQDNLNQFKEYLKKASILSTSKEDIRKFIYIF